MHGGGTAPELRGHLGKIAEQHARRQTSRFVCLRATKDVGEECNAGDEEFHLCSGSLGRGLRAGALQGEAIEECREIIGREHRIGHAGE